ncbi:MAG: DUF7670 domain-containing protein, partial [Bacteroidota bacterium]
AICSNGGIMQLHIDRIIILRTVGRVLAFLLFILWGSFFIEHLSWFRTESMNTPPVRIWFAQGSHFLLLLGYLVSLKWERIGSLFIVINAILFFGYAAGTKAVPFIIISILPVLFYGYCWIRSKQSSVRMA